MKDAMWLYPGLVSDDENYPSFDVFSPPENHTTYNESNFWVAVYTDRNIQSGGFTFTISAGEFPVAKGKSSSS